MGSEFPIRLWMNRMVKYLLIPCVMCCALLPLYGIFHQQTVKAQMTDTAEHLASSVSTFERYLYDLRFTTNKLFYTPEYTLLAASDDDAMLSDEANTNAAMILLEDLTYNMQAVSYSYVTFARNTLVIDNCRTYSSYTRFYPNVLQYQNLSREEWVARIYSEELTCFPSQQVSLYQTSYPEDYLTISQPFFNSLGRYTGSCTMLLREKQLIQLFLPQQNWQEHCLFYIADRDGQQLLTHGLQDNQLPVPFGDSGIEIYQGQEYMFVSRPIPELDAVAVMGLPRSVYAKDLLTVERGIWFYILATVAVCLVLSLVMTLRDIQQLKPLTESLGSLKRADTRLLNNLILQKLQAHTQLAMELERTRDQIDHARVESLLKTGSVSSAREEEELRRLLMLGKCNYLLLIPGPKEPEEATTRELRVMLTAEHLNQYFGRPHYVHAAVDGSILTVLSQEDTAQEPTLRQKAEQLHEALDLTQSLILSASFTRLEQLSSVYWQARNALSHGDRDKAVCTLSAQVWGRTLVPEVGTLERLQEYLLSGCTEQAQTLIRESFQGRDMTLDSFRQSFYSLRGVLLTAAEQSACEDIHFLCAYDPALSQTRQIQNLCECCLVIASHVDELKQSHNTQLRQNIFSFLESHCSNPELNAAMVAEKFGISRKYVSQFLKDQTGKSFTEYLEELRLTRAMKLLRETDHTVMHIAAMCGFFSQNTFYKAFRRRYDLSPSAVRRDRPKGGS